MSFTLWNPPAEVHEAEFHRADAEIERKGALRKGLILLTGFTDASMLRAVLFFAVESGMFTLPENQIRIIFSGGSEIY